MSEESSFQELVSRTLTGLLTGQQEMTTLYKGQKGRLNTLAEQVEALEEGQESLIEASEKQETLIQELIGLMGRFAQGQVDIRKTLAEHDRRLEALEKKAS